MSIGTSTNNPPAGRIPPSDLRAAARLYAAVSTSSAEDDAVRLHSYADVAQWRRRFPVPEDAGAPAP